MSDVHYVKNANGDVHSVDGEHFERYCKTTVRGRAFLLPGWQEITADEARAANPQLFGARDRNVVYTAQELKEIRERKRLEAEMFAEEQEINDEIAAAEAEDEAEDEAENEAAPPVPSGRRR